MSRDVLIIATMDGVENCAAAISEQTGVDVDVAHDRETGLSALRYGDYGVVVMEETLAEGDPGWADHIWAEAGLAMPLQVNFAVASCARLGREIKAALLRRDGEHALARRAAATEIENELKGSVTGLLLQSELALREPSLSPTLEPKLRSMMELAGAIRERLRRASEQAAWAR